VSTILWRQIGDSLSPLGMNLGRCTLGTAFLALATLLTGAEAVDLRSFLYLAVSGVLGIAVADTYFFASLVLLGARTASVVGTLGPVFTALAAVGFLGERPSASVWLGIGLTTAGVACVVWRRSAEPEAERRWRRGLAYAFLSLAATTAAVLLAKRGVAAMPALQGTLIRMAWGAAGLLGWMAVTGGRLQAVAPLRDARLFSKVALTVFVGTFGGLWLSLVGLKLADASVAAVLNSTTPLFVLPLGAVILGERLSGLVVLGAVVAVAGVSLVLTATWS
jgi:drug/metabolite transporter (DMT)-like permease